MGKTVYVSDFDKGQIVMASCPRAWTSEKAHFAGFSYTAIVRPYRKESAFDFPLTSRVRGDQRSSYVNHWLQSPPQQEKQGPMAQYAADNDELTKTDISTPVTVDQRAANYLGEAVRSFTAMRSRGRSLHADVTFRRPLPVFRIVRCSSVHCIQNHITVELFRGPRAPIARLENPSSRRSVILPVQTPSVVRISPYFAAEAYLGLSKRSPLTNNH
ncbi:uncharacterized protein TNCV_2709401 [Trichonephila clavipes]|nr:uncharacterized protein TNCV_2709401 [Trichonephila clavipes]